MKTFSTTVGNSKYTYFVYCYSHLAKVMRSDDNLPTIYTSINLKSSDVDLEFLLLVLEWTTNLDTSRRLMLCSTNSLNFSATFLSISPQYEIIVSRRFILYCKTKLPLKKLFNSQILPIYCISGHATLKRANNVGVVFKWGWVALISIESSISMVVRQVLERVKYPTQNFVVECVTGVASTVYYFLMCRRRYLQV